MSAVATSAPDLQKATTKKMLLGLAMFRAVLGIVAIPLAPFLYEEHFLVLVLLRPTKEVFLLGGFLARQAEVNVVAIALAAIPLSIFGVWIFFLLGRAYAREIASDRLPGFAARIFTRERIQKFERSLEKRGPKLIFLGRLAVMSSATVATAAGVAKMEPKKFFAWDLAGGCLSIAYTVGTGWILGETYEAAGPWITVAGIAALIGFALILGRSLQKD
jgi:membrane protein DedA with SNARE-associated domain